MLFILIALTSAQEFDIFSKASVPEEKDFAFAQSLYRNSLFQLAGEQFKSFIKKYPNNLKQQDAVFLHAECMFATQQYQSAANSYIEFISNFPYSRYIPDAYFHLGMANLSLKKTSEAIKVFKFLLDKYGDSKVAGNAAYWLGEAYLRNNDIQNALKYYTLAYENYPQNQLRDITIYSIALTNQKHLNFKKASEWYDKLIVEFPQSSLAHGAQVRIGESFYYAKEYCRAIDELKKSRQNILDEEELGNADYLIAKSFFKLSEYAEAQKRFEKFLTDHPNNAFIPQATYDLGWCYLIQNDYPKSIENFNLLVERPDELGNAALYRRSVVERLLGKNEVAYQTLIEVMNRDVSGEWIGNALFDAGMLLFEQNKISEAKSYFKRLISENPQSEVLPDGCLMLGECLLAENEFKEAQQYFEKAVLIKTASFEAKVDASFYSAWCSFKLEHYEEAAAKFVSFIEKYPKHPKSSEAKYWQAEAEYRLGNYKTSSLGFQEAASSSIEKQGESFYGMAWSFYKLKKYLQAIEVFEKLIATYPNSGFVFDSRLRIGDAYFLLEDFKKAIGSYRTVIRMFPDSLSLDYAYYQLGLSYIKDGDNTEAFKAFEGLIKSLPKSLLVDDAQFALGRINFQQKEYGEAIKEFQTLLNDYPSSELIPRAYISIGDCYYNLQQYVSAGKIYQEVLKLYPNSSYIAGATDGIQNCLVAQEKKPNEAGKIDSLTQYKGIQGTKTDTASFIFWTSQQLLQQHEKINSEYYLTTQRTSKVYSIGNYRDQEIVELKTENRIGVDVNINLKYSGMIQLGLGTYFSPLANLEYGQVLSNFHYTIDGNYYLTDGFAPNTNQSGGGIIATGGTTMQSGSSILNNAILDGKIGTQRESFRFYGSSTPELVRTLSDFHLQAILENHTLASHPYSMGFAFKNLIVRDSTTSITTNQIDLGLTTDIYLSSLPIQSKLILMTASNGIWFTDLSGAIQYRWLEELIFQTSLHLYWAEGTVGQKMVRLRPHISVNYQMSKQHRIYAAYEPSVAPLTLATILSKNRYLESSATVGHQDITNSVELGLESDWSVAIRSRCSFRVQSVKDNALFSELSSKPGWGLIYGEKTIIMIGLIEMVAKLTVNDYFAYGVLLRSAKDSFWGNRIPYSSPHEVNVKATHVFGSVASVSMDLKILGERYTDVTNINTIPGFVVLDVSGEYKPMDFLKFFVTVHNLTNTKYYIWNRYQEFPLTIHFAVQLNW